MNRWAYQYQPKALVGGCVTDGVVCPRPRRVPLHFHDPIRPPSRLLHLNNQQAEACDAKAGTELLDIIRMKKGNFQVGSSPPYYSGSPPTRASNPVIQDEQFGNENPLSSSSSSSSRRNGGGIPPRIKGFNCRGHCSISYVA